MLITPIRKKKRLGRFSNIPVLILFSFFRDGVTVLQPTLTVTL